MISRSFGSFLITAFDIFESTKVPRISVFLSSVCIVSGSGDISTR